MFRIGTYLLLGRIPLHLRSARQAGLLVGALARCIFVWLCVPDGPSELLSRVRNCLLDIGRVLEAGHRMVGHCGHSTPLCFLACASYARLVVDWNRMLLLDCTANPHQVSDLVIPRLRSSINGDPHRARVAVHDELDARSTYFLYWNRSDALAWLAISPASVRTCSVLHNSLVPTRKSRNHTERRTCPGLLSDSHFDHRDPFCNSIVHLRAIGQPHRRSSFSSRSGSVVGALKLFDL